MSLKNSIKFLMLYKTIFQQSSTYYVPFNYVFIHSGSFENILLLFPFIRGFQVQGRWPKQSSLCVAPITQQLQRGQQQKNSRLKHQTIFLRKNRIFQTEFVTLNIEIKRVHMYTNIPSRLGEFTGMTTYLKYFLHFPIR